MDSLIVGTLFLFEYQLGAALGFTSSYPVTSSSSCKFESESFETSCSFGAFSLSLPASIKEYSTVAVDSSNFGLGFYVFASNFLSSSLIY